MPEKPALLEYMKERGYIPEDCPGWCKAAQIKAEHGSYEMRIFNSMTIRSELDKQLQGTPDLGNITDLDVHVVYMGNTCGTSYAGPVEREIGKVEEASLYAIAVLMANKFGIRFSKGGDLRYLAQIATKQAADNLVKAVRAYDKLVHHPESRKLKLTLAKKTKLDERIIRAFRKQGIYGLDDTIIRELRKLGVCV